MPSTRDQLPADDPFSLAGFRWEVPVDGYRWGTHKVIRDRDARAETARVLMPVSRDLRPAVRTYNPSEIPELYRAFRARVLRVPGGSK